MASVSSTSSSTSSTATVSNGRYWGLASGLDVDTIVKGLLSDEQSKIDKAKQKEQTLEWKQDAYRNIITKLQTFESSYLQLGSSSSMAASNMYSTYTASSNNTDYLTAAAGADATGTAKTVTILQSAKAATLTGTGAFSSIKSTVNIGTDGLTTLQNYASAAESAGLADPSFNVTIDGVTKTLSFSSSDLSGITQDTSGMLSLINNKLGDAFGKVPQLDSNGNVIVDQYVTKVQASDDGSGKLVLSNATGYNSVISISANSIGFDTRLLGAEATAADSLGTAEPKLTVTYNGTSKDISFTKDDDLSSANIQTTINNKLEAAFSGQGLTAAVGSDGTLSIKDGSGKSVSYTTANTSFNALEGLGLTSGQKNRLDLNSKVSSLISITNPITITNGQGVKTNVTLTSNMTVSDAFNAINNSGAGVQVTYDSTTDTVSVKSTQSGSAGAFDLSNDTSGLFSALGITPASAKGQDAVVSITEGTNTSTYTRPTNSFSIGGVNYNIVKDVALGSSVSSTVSMTPNTTSLKTGINNFITAYNDLVTSISLEIDTKPDSDYAPLTDTQKSSMTQDQIDKWNTKAQQGVLFNDDTLQSLLDNLRSALYKPVTTSDGKTVSLFDFGITTSDDTTANGILEVKSEDEQTFEDALSNNVSEIKDFFTKQSSIRLNISSGLTAKEQADQQTRTSEEGLVDRLDDIIKGASSTVGGTPGTLLSLAGAVGSATQYNNTIYTELLDLNQIISDYNDELKTKQDRLYTQFENLETYMSKANSQSSYISSMLG